MANEDPQTYPLRKLMISQLRAHVGAHYLRGTSGVVPSKTSTHLSKNGKPSILEDGTTVDSESYFTYRNSHRVCSGRHGHADVLAMPPGDPSNPAHMANPAGYRWQRVVRFAKLNYLEGESCIGKVHFDCIGFIRWGIRSCLPTFRAALKAKGVYAIDQYPSMLQTVSSTGVDTGDLCAGDILIRGAGGHIGWAIGDGQRVVHAIREDLGVIESEVGQWEYHGRIPAEYWLAMYPTN